MQAQTPRDMVVDSPLTTQKTQSGRTLACTNLVVDETGLQRCEALLQAADHLCVLLHDALLRRALCESAHLRQMQRNIQRAAKD